MDNPKKFARISGLLFTVGQYPCKFNWPDTCTVQCGDGGIVFTKQTMEDALSNAKATVLNTLDIAIHNKQQNEEFYRTAFFEAFPQNPETFIRGEGKTIEEAEMDCWAQFEKIIRCKQHEFERKGRTDGYAYCKHCKLSGMFLECLTKCCICNEPTNYCTDTEKKYYCKAHEKCIPEDKITDNIRLLRKLAHKLE